MATEREITKYTPAFEPVNLREPNATEQRMDNIFVQFMEKEIEIESDTEMRRRDEVLAQVRDIFLQWVKDVAVKVLKMTPEEAEDAGGQMFISGSHRLGVRDVGADIDTVCVAPNFCTREHFFTLLKETLMQRSEITDLVAIEDANVPLISFDFYGVSIDLLFARMADPIVPPDMDILDDQILLGLDQQSEKSLNGPRVTNMIFKLVGEKTFPNFLIVLRFIRRWAKRRGIYGNKLGYLGGVNCNILVAFICQLYPNAGPSSLLYRFFKQYKDWKWPEPIMLNNLQHSGPTGMLSEERVVWKPENNPYDVMPLITPAYPAMNSAYNVSEQSFAVMYNEIDRAHYIITEHIIKDKQWEHPEAWKEILEPSDFFLKYRHYLACHIVGTGDNNESLSWIGFVESRIRRILGNQFLQSLPLKMPIHLHPVLSKTKKSANSICYFIGFDVDVDHLHHATGGSNQLLLDDVISRFQDSLWDAERGFKGERAEGLDFFIEHLKWKELPRELFAAYGGYESAKQMRKDYLQQQAAMQAEEEAAAEGDADGADGTAEAARGGEQSTAGVTPATGRKRALSTSDNNNNIYGPGDTSAKKMTPFEQRLAAAAAVNNDANKTTAAMSANKKRTNFIKEEEEADVGPDGLPTLAAIRRRYASYVLFTPEELLAAAKLCKMESVAEFQAKKKAKLGHTDEKSFTMPTIEWKVFDTK